jgi:CRISPR-associated protein (TIGR03986 family)
MSILKLQTRKIKFDKNPKFNRRATAPYNFVPLNQGVVAAELVEALPGFAAYDTANRKTGWLECEIETLTPIHIRGAVGKNEFHAGKPATDFFSPAGKIRLPGSSLRGMARTLVEILSWSKFDTDGDRVFHYRGLADMSNLRKEYQSHMSSFNTQTKSTLYKMSAGYLEKAGAAYRIIPARKINGKQFYQIPKTETAAARAKVREAEIRIFTGGNKEEFCFFRSGANSIAVSGNMPNKKRDWVIHPADKQTAKIAIPETDLRNYLLDENRNGPNLIEELKRLGVDSIPCFYVEWRDRQNQKRLSFGHTAMFRLAYAQCLGDLLPEAHADDETVDLAEAIFGTVSGKYPVASRVYFEDATLVAAPAEPKSAIPQILSSPKPTTFQHYLVQTTDAVKELSHYDSETILRGHKLYWHRLAAWQATSLSLDLNSFEQFLRRKNLQMPPPHKKISGKKIAIVNFPAIKDENLKAAVFEFVTNDPKSQYTVIKPILPGAKFKAKIRFENLSDVELGALLSALQLPESCCHKIGMAKPLGLGSVKIASALFLSDRQKRYTSLLHEWMASPPPESEDMVKRLKMEFERYVLRQLGASEKPASNNLWDTPRLKQLRVMLNWKNTEIKNWQEKTRYLEIEHAENGNEYKTRPVLPIPEEVAKS